MIGAGFIAFSFSADGHFQPHFLISIFTEMVFSPDIAATLRHDYFLLSAITPLFSQPLRHAAITADLLFSIAISRRH